MTEIVLKHDRHLKWRSLDGVEHVLMILGGICLACFTTSVFFDVLTRQLGHPWLWLQEVTSAFFTYGIFIGTAVATRRQDHLQLSALTELMRGRWRTGFETMNRVVILAVGLAMVVFGWQNFLHGFQSFRMPSMLPIAYLYWPIPVCGAFVVLFSLEQIVNGLKHGYEAQRSGGHDHGG
ncbi:MAG: TRAP transporter small permease [Acetobacteraceae bacterium]|nr:TRAP transporter small permease [Acetobacteraceae bacterium]